MAIPYKFLKETSEWDDEQARQMKAKLEELQYQASLQMLQQQMQQYQYQNAFLAGGSALGSPFQYQAIPATPAVQIDRSRISQLKTVEARAALPRIPDRIEPIIAWRAWTPSGKQLKAIGQGVAWPAKKPMKAKCVSRGGHKAPDMSCECGIWAFRDLDTLLPAADSYATRDLIVGSVYLWGRVIECENGFRAEYAYPKELWCMKPEHEELGLVYNVPVRV